MIEVRRLHYRTLANSGNALSSDGPMLGAVRAGDCPGAAGHAADLFGYAIKTLSTTSRQNLDFYAGVYNF
jgi:hypothetical protein